MTRGRLLIVNADDFGFTADVNDGILETHRNGIVTATTLMAMGSAFEHAVRLARQNPSLDVGCHLVLTGGLSAIPPHRPLPDSPAALATSVLLGRIEVEAELRAQIGKVRDAGLAPTHLDTHKHTHLLPQVAAAVGRLSRESGIPWVRRPLDGPVIGRWNAAILRRCGCRMTDHFEGFGLTGKLNVSSLADLLARLPDGITELMCHPGYLRDELRDARTRLKESREAELAALTGPDARAALQSAGIRLVNYRELG